MQVADDFDNLLLYDMIGPSLYTYCLWPIALYILYNPKLLLPSL